jgi:hypothetical protein
VAAAGQVSWPPAGSYLAVCGQFLVAVVIPAVRAIRAGYFGLERDSVPSFRAPLPGAPQGLLRLVDGRAGYRLRRAGPSSYPPVAGRCG